MAIKNIRTFSKAAVIAILASVSFAVACGDDSDDEQTTPPATGGSSTNEGGSGGGNATGGSDNTGGSDATGGLGGGGGNGTGGSAPECFKNDGTCYELSDTCIPKNSEEFKNASGDCGEDCVYSFDNSSLSKLNADGTLPPLD